MNRVALLLRTPAVALWDFDHPAGAAHTDPEHEVSPNDSISPVAPFRIVNIGNSKPVKLLDFIEVIEKTLGKKATCNYLPMQPGDVPATWASAELLRELTGYQPATDIRDGVAEFVKWFRDYYRK